jgi:hypothetical protein
MKVEVGISQGGKALIVQEDGVLTGGFLYELQKLMIEWDVKSIKDGVIELTNNNEDLTSTDVTYTHIVKDPQAHLSTFIIPYLHLPATWQEIKDNIHEEEA